MYGIGGGGGKEAEGWSLWRNVLHCVFITLQVLRGVFDPLLSLLSTSKHLTPHARKVLCVLSLSICLSLQLLLICVFSAWASIFLALTESSGSLSSYSVSKGGGGGGSVRGSSLGVPSAAIRVRAGPLPPPLVMVNLEVNVLGACVTSFFFFLHTLSSLSVEGTSEVVS